MTQLPAETEEAAIARVKEYNISVGKTHLNHQPIEITGETPGYWLATSAGRRLQVRKRDGFVELH